MARFCTQCGSPVEETLRFCPKCGAQLAAAAAPAQAPAAQATPTIGAPRGAAAAPPAAPPAKKGSPVLKIVLLVLGVFVLVGILSAAAGIYFLYKAKQKVSGMIEAAKTVSSAVGTPEVEIKKGGAGSAAAASATVDVPPYPGSTPTSSGGGISLGSLGGVSGQEFETPDPVEKVLDFYKEKFGSKISIQQSEGTATFSLKVRNAVTTVTITRDEEAGKTKINIARMGK